MSLHKIISGGQTGVDRAALDAAISVSIAHGGWCPKGRLAELGTTIPTKYMLNETSSPDFSERTKRNIQDSDGTLIIVPSIPIQVTDGTLLTLEEVKSKNKPYLLIALSEIRSQNSSQMIFQWITDHAIETLNIAGPRESQSPGIYQASFDLLKKALEYITLKQTY